MKVSAVLCSSRRDAAKEVGRNKEYGREGEGERISAVSEAESECRSGNFRPKTNEKSVLKVSGMNERTPSSAVFRSQLEKIVLLFHTKL